MRLVVLESPYAGNVDTNIAYARECVRHCLSLNDSPIVSHLLFTQPGILNDDIPEERNLGINAGHAWLRVAHASVVYTDLGISPGMQRGITAARSSGLPVEFRSIRPGSARS